MEKNEQIIENKIKEILNINIKKLKDILKMEDKENIIFIDYFTKINVKKKKQKRIFILTNFYFYNIGEKLNYLKILFKKNIKRKIDISIIDGLIVSSNTNYFVLKMDSEYDYLLSYNKNEEFFETLIQTVKNELKIYYINETDLYKYTKYENMNNKEIINKKSSDFLDLNTFQIIKIKSKSINYLKNKINFYSENQISLEHFLNFNIKSKFFKNYDFYLFNFNKNDYHGLIINLKKYKINDIKEYISLTNNIDNDFLIKIEYVFEVNNHLIILKKFNNLVNLKKNINNYKFNEKFINTIFLNLLKFLKNWFEKNNFIFNLSLNNVFIDTDYNLKVIDYFEENLILNEFRRNTLYNPPESKDNFNSLDKKKSFIWNIGLILFELLTNYFKINKIYELDKSNYYEKMKFNIETNFEIKKILKKILVPIDKRISFEELMNSPLVSNLFRNSYIE